MWHTPKSVRVNIPLGQRGSHRQYVLSSTPLTVNQEKVYIDRSKCTTNTRVDIRHQLPALLFALLPPSSHINGRHGIWRPEKTRQPPDAR